MRQGARHPYRDAPTAIPRPRARRSYVRGWMITVVGMPIAMIVATWVVSAYGTADANVIVASPFAPIPTTAPTALEPAPTPVVPAPIPPAPLDTPGPCADFDTAVVTAALVAVGYTDCGTGGPGKVAVTFAPSGVVLGSSVTAGAYPAAIRSCIAGRFRAVKIPPFCPPDPKTVGWGIDL